MGGYASGISYSDDRFKFGENWNRFLSVINEGRIAEAEKSLREMIGVDDLAGKNFLDIGSGSGLFSLAARRLGATVYSFDYDPQSVACTEELRRRYSPNDRGWTIEEGSALDSGYLESLGQFDIVYSWGVLHHTGSMWEALDKVTSLVSPGGVLFIAIYNDQGNISGYWKTVKRAYNKNPVWRLILILAHFPYLYGIRFMVRLLTGRLKIDRGMSLWYDMKDWLGGYPFETAMPGQILDFYLDRGFSVQKIRTCGRRHGCNEFVFRRND